MRKELTNTISAYAAIILFIGLGTMRQNGTNFSVMLWFSLLLLGLAVLLIGVINSKKLWLLLGYYFTSAEITTIEVLRSNTGRVRFFIKPGLDQHKLLKITFAYWDTDNQLVSGAAAIWQREHYRYLADIDSGHYQSRTYNYQIGDTIEIMIKVSDPNRITIW